MPSLLPDLDLARLAGIPIRVSHQLPLQGLDADDQEEGEIHAIHFAGEGQLPDNWFGGPAHGPGLLVSPQLKAELDEWAETERARQVFDAWMEEAEVELHRQRQPKVSHE